MDKEKAKKAAELAEKELQEERERRQVELIKKAISQTLEKIKDKEKERNCLNKEIKTLKQDMDNIRDGRLDLIAERQEKDEGAKKTSIIEVVKEKEVHHYHHYDRWYEPYKIYIKEPYYWSYPLEVPVTTVGTNTIDTSADTFTHQIVTNSVAKDSWAGTYEMSDGNFVTLT